MASKQTIDSNFESLTPSSTLYINETVQGLWQKGKQVLHMGFGESRFDVHPRLQEALFQHANKKSYLPAQGVGELREVIANYYTQKLSSPFSASQVIVGPGSKALIYGLQLVLDADVFLPSPSWVSYAPQAQLLNRTYHYVPSNVANNYQLSIEKLNEQVERSTKSCKLLIINSPNNPTGDVLDEAFIKELADYCRERQILVISDEIYFEVCHGDIPHVSISRFYPEGTFVLGGLSKHLSIGGWRLGVAVLPENKLGKTVMQLMNVVASEIWSSVCAPVQYAAIEAYSLHQDIETYVADCTKIHGIRSRFIEQKLVSLGIHCTASKGAFYLMPNFDKWRDQLAKQNVHSSFDLAKHLLEKHQLASLPGSDFGLADSTLSLRLSTSYLDMEKDGDAKKIYKTYKRYSSTQERLADNQLMSQDLHPSTHATIDRFETFLSSIS
jgi:aspartate/methionine/tyrosine aminotransferase